MHTPVLVKEVLDALGVGSGGAYIDCTVGEGGHTEAILNAAPDCVVIGLDRDPSALATASERLAGFGERVRLVNASYTTLAEQGQLLGGRPVTGVLLDLGLSSMQVEDGERGFSFLRDGPLDMRFGPDEKFTADDVVNHFSERDLVRIIHEFGEEPRARRVARAIVQRRPIRGTAQLGPGGGGSAGTAGTHSPGHPHIPGHPHRG